MPRKRLMFELQLNRRKTTTTNYLAQVQSCVHRHEDEKKGGAQTHLQLFFSNKKNKTKQTSLAQKIKHSGAGDEADLEDQAFSCLFEMK